MNASSTSPRARFGIRFSLLARGWRRALDAHLAAAGLTDATWVPLIHLQETGGGITQKELAALVGIDGSSLVRVIDILARQGLLERRSDPADGRARLIYLTPEGEARITEIRRELIRVEEQLLADIPDGDLIRMLGHFDLIEQRVAALEVASQQEDRS